MTTVVKVSQSGFDVKTAGDQDLVFSSEFPVLKEEKSGLFDAISTSVYVPVYEHNLSYDPFFLIYDSQGQFVLGSGWGVDENKLYIGPDVPSGTYRWVVYRLKLFENYEAPALKVQFTSAGGDDRRFGIKISKEGKDISSTDLRDFTIHSRARSPLVHKVSAKDWTGSAQDNHTVDPGLPYNPIAFGFAKLSNVSAGEPAVTTNLISGGQSIPKLSRNAGTRQIVINSAGTATSKTSVVLFKDPILAPKIVKVSY